MTKNNKIISFFTDIGQKFVSFLFPENFTCVFCDNELDQNFPACVCQKCEKALPHLTVFCEQCGNPDVMEGECVCDHCKGKSMPFEKARSVFVYEDKITAVVHRFKYGGKKYLAKPFAEMMADCFSKQFTDVRFDCIVPVPMHAKKKKKRGYNQAEILAKELSQILNIPLETKGIERISDNTAQAELNFAERQKNLAKAFICEKKFFSGKTILLVDDVFTTGATARVVCEALKTDGKAKEIGVLTLAHTSLNDTE